MATPHELPSTPLLRVVRPVLRPLSAVYRFAPKGPPDWRDPEAHKARVHYDHRPLRSVVELDLLLQAMREALPSVKIPVMFIHSDEDTFVPPQHMEANFAALGSADKQKRLVQNSNHVITCDLARHEVFEAAAGFIARVAGPGS
jgi:carboxylesterase